MKAFKPILLILLIVNTLTFAGGNITSVKKTTHVKEVTKPMVLDTSDLYVGIGISGMKLKNNLTKESFEAKGVMLQVGYKITDYLALEARYTHHIGDVEYDHGSDHRVNESVDIEDYPTDFTNIAIYFKPSYSYNKVTAYALLGYGEVKLTNIPLGDVDRAEDGFQWGAGVAYEINENLLLFVDYIVFYDNKGFDYRATNADIKVDALSTGVSYRF
jgi:opacity protein-like surface antigen